jgi:hypothetical protein
VFVPENFPGLSEEGGCLLEEEEDRFLLDALVVESFREVFMCVDLVFFLTGDGSGELLSEVE